jgi:hypothetical protein
LDERAVLIAAYNGIVVYVPGGIVIVIVSLGAVVPVVENVRELLELS